MTVTLTKPRFRRASIALVAGVLAVSSGVALAAATKVTLSGDQEVPA